MMSSLKEVDMKPAIIQLHALQGRVLGELYVLYENLLSACYCLRVAQIPFVSFHRVSKILH